MKSFCPRLPHQARLAHAGEGLGIEYWSAPVSTR